MSPCFVTLTFTNVNRQYGQVIVGTDVAMVASLSCRSVRLLDRSALKVHSGRQGGPWGQACRPGTGHPRSVTVVLG
jgi:hypothetical protein